jgi:hypothetical protein
LADCCSTKVRDLFWFTSVGEGCDISLVKGLKQVH